jgi:hypothetical protein
LIAAEVEEMNLLDWNRQHQVAGIAFCAIGAIVGNFFAWMDSPFRQLSSHSISEVWADTTGVFLLWLSPSIMGSGQLSAHAPRDWHFTVYLQLSRR